MLGRSCSCTTDEMWLSGPALPLEWGEEVQALVKIELGFDPRNPEALGAIRGFSRRYDDLLVPAPTSDALVSLTELSDVDLHEMFALRNDAVRD